MSAPTLAEAVAQYGRDAYLLIIAMIAPGLSFGVGRSQGQRHCVRHREVCRQEHRQQAQRCGSSGRQESRAAMLSSSMAQPPDGASRAA